MDNWPNTPTITQPRIINKTLIFFTLTGLFMFIVLIYFLINIFKFIDIKVDRDHENYCFR
jgi:hypothetical protein